MAIVFRLRWVKYGTVRLMKYLVKSIVDTRPNADHFITTSGLIFTDISGYVCGMKVPTSAKHNMPLYSDSNSIPYVRWFGNNRKYESWSVRWLLQWCNMSATVSQIEAFRMFAKEVVKANNKGDIRAVHYWPFDMRTGGFTPQRLMIRNASIAFPIWKVWDDF